MIHVLIPAYNEQDNIGDCILNLDKCFAAIGEKFKVLIVDDGSRDGTVARLKELSQSYEISWISHETNLGVGLAFRHGFERIIETCGDDDILFTIEADNTGSYQTIPRMLEQIRDGADLVLASCYAPGGQVQGSNYHRLLISRAANLISGAIFNLGGLHAYSSFFRVIRVGALKRANVAWDNRLVSHPGFVCMLEMLVKLRFLPVDVREIPSMLNCDQRKGRSKLKVFKTTLEYLKFFLANAFSIRKRAAIARAKFERPSLSHII